MAVKSLQRYQAIPHHYLLDNGLNMQAVLDLKSLPEYIATTLSADSVNLENWDQLLLFANGGKDFWRALPAGSFRSDNPVDDFSVQVVKDFFKLENNGVPYKFIYPGDIPVDLQGLGALVGWHNPSPFLVGINQDWGSWFAYRVVVLANTNYRVTMPVKIDSPCDSCKDKPCIRSCHANAIINEKLDINACVEYRKQPDSKCQTSCASRLACPVGRDHAYQKEQLVYHYKVSLESIRHYC